MDDARTSVKFRTWMPLVAVLIVLLSVALVFLYGVPATRSRLTDFGEDRAFTQAAAAAQAISGARGADLGRELDLAAETTGGEVLFVDTRARVVARAGSVGGFEASRDMLRGAAAGTRMSGASGRFVVAVAPVLDDGTLGGGVVFASDEPESTAYRLFLRSGLEAAGIASILGGGLMLLLGAMLSRRVERLSLGARYIEGGNLSYRLEPGFKDELGDLAGTFNAMAARLEDSFANLENRVAERTAELEAERARLETVLRQMPSGVVIAEAPSGKVTLSNEQAERIRGRSLPPYVVAPGFGEYRGLRPDGRSYAPEEWPLARSLGTGEEVSDEEIVIARGRNTQATVRVSSSPIRGRDGDIVAGVAIFSDVTEQKRAREELRESEERYRVVAETASDAIVIIDEDSRVVFANGAAEKIFGYARAEVLGQSLTMLMPERLREVHRASLGRYLDTGRRRLSWDSVQLPALRKSGQEFPAEISFGEFAKDGKRFFTGFIRDITERKRAEEEIRTLNEDLERRVEERTAQLQGERAMLGTILNNLAEGVLACDSRERIVFANPAARSMLGLSGRKQIATLPNPWKDFDLPEMVARCVRERGGCVEVRVENREALLQLKLEHLPKLGDEGGGGALIVMQDLSEGRRLEARQQRFLANAAHELKTPITTILGSSDLLLTEEEDDPELRRRFLNHIFTEAQRMQRLAETLLRLARVGWDFREPEVGLVSLDATAREVLWRMTPLAESSGVGMSFVGEGGLVRADGEWLEQALMVIVSNAIKYSGRGGRIVLRLDRGTVAVEDEGEGISEDELPHVFDRFYQGEGGSGGFGLGLPICKELVERMGGGITIESEEGIGTTVRIELEEVNADE